VGRRVGLNEGNDVIGGLRRTGFAGQLEDAAASVVDRALGGEGGYGCLVNVHLLTTATHDPDVAAALAGAWAIFPDGWPVAWLLRKLGKGDATRIPGPDLLPETVDQGCGCELKHFLLGSTEPVLDAMEQNLRAAFPDAVIVGRFSPPFGVVDGSSVAAVRATAPHVVWCGLGAPKQELWMQAHAPELAPAIVLGVGAAFDFAAGTRRRAPALMQELGLEWLHRLVSEPNRLWRRYFVSNLRFMALALQVARPLSRRPVA
jgi:N-acetylglucosaminyldiphosphoundecaprenol N-acetyl-beta-D-mannosaminyltransferase